MKGYAISEDVKIRLDMDLIEMENTAKTRRPGCSMMVFGLRLRFEGEG